MTFVPAHGAGYVTAEPRYKDVAITVPIPFGTLASTGLGSLKSLMPLELRRLASRVKRQVIGIMNGTLRQAASGTRAPHHLGPSTID